MIIIDGVNIESLIISAQTGDKKAMEELIKMYKPFIIKNARQIYINGYEVEDLIQIGIMGLIKAVYKYQPERKAAFTGFAITIIRNTFNLELRKIINKKWDEKFKCSLNSLTSDGIEFMEMLVSDESVEEDVILKGEIDVLRESLSKLSEDEREIINWFYFEDKLLKEYALEKGISINCAAKRKLRALEKLRKYFD